MMYHPEKEDPVDPEFLGNMPLRLDAPISSTGQKRKLGRPQDSMIAHIYHKSEVHTGAAPAIGSPQKSCKRTEAVKRQLEKIRKAQENVPDGEGDENTGATVIQNILR